MNNILSNHFFLGTTDLKTKVMFMELKESRDRLDEEIQILEREMQDLLQYCEERIQQGQNEQHLYSMYSFKI